jgi:hypothetical protein
MGRARMLRVRYEEFIGTPEKVFREVLDFLGEPYCADCEKPLDNKINSSKIEPEALKMRESSSAAREATELYQHILSAPAPGMQADAAAQTEIKQAFLEHCRNTQAPPMLKQLGMAARLLTRLKPG